MRRPLATLAAALLAASAPAARAEAPPPPAAALAGEVDADAFVGSFHGLTLKGWEVRLGLGRRQVGAISASGFPAGRAPRAVDVLVTGGLSRARTPAGLVADGRRLGAGVRLRGDRLFLGADAEGIWLVVPRVSTSGHLAGSGLGARLLGGADLFSLGRAALVASLDVTLDGYDIFASPSWLPSVHLGAGLRF